MRRSKHSNKAKEFISEHYEIMMGAPQGSVLEIILDCSRASNERKSSILTSKLAYYSDIYV